MVVNVVIAGYLSIHIVFRVTVMTEVDDEIFTVCTVQETTRYLISGVRDPVTDAVISLEEALSREIIDQEKGLYWYDVYTHSLAIIDCD